MDDLQKLTPVELNSRFGSGLTLSNMITQHLPHRSHRVTAY